jgi:hypothetical protein
MLNNPNWKQPDVKPDLDEIGKVFLRTADYIEEHGWCQHQLRDPKGRVCLAAAITKDMHNYDDGGATINAWGLLKRSLGGSAMKWNDAPERTKDEVIAKLKELAYAARS